MSDATLPLIVLTVTNPGRHADRDLAVRKNERYAEAVRRHGGHPLLIDGTSSDEDREAAFAAMDGLLLTGGADIDPAYYGRPNLGSVASEPERDALEAAAWSAAAAREVPVFGVCRGFQAINVFAGGTLIQDVPDHAGPGWSTGPAKMHPIRIVAGSALAGAVADEGDAPQDISVNTYHHQAVGRDDLAPGLVASAWSAGPDGDLVEALELPGERFVVGVQCHPERTEFSPAGFERLWSAFVGAARAREPRDDPRRSPAGGTAASAPRAAR
jgi:gamma-glutamyl-gamma-aminobutyrate hydrolase PuuD